MTGSGYESIHGDKTTLLQACVAEKYNWQSQTVNIQIQREEQNLELSPRQFKNANGLI